MRQIGLRVPLPWLRIPLRGWVLASGLLTWLSAVLLPCLHRGQTLSLVTTLLLLLGPVALGLGLKLAQAHDKTAAYALLTGFPISLALPLSRLDHDHALATFSAENLGISLFSFAAFLALASTLCAHPRAIRAVEHRPLGEIAPVESEARKQRIGQLTLGVVFLGAIGMVTLSASETPAHFREVWGRAAPEGATLTALTAGIVGALALSIVGPALRAARGPLPSASPPRKVLWLLSVAASGLVAYALLRSA